jgi:hydroxyethylthiazole kinase
MTASDFAPRAAALAARLRAESPLVVNITNYVAMNFAANVLLAAGASPVMAHAPEEMDEMLAFAGALTINFGTLDVPWVKAMTHAGIEAQRAAKPVVFDPVGAGATTFRTGTALGFLKSFPVAVLRANSSEILALASAPDAPAATKGVDATDPVDAALPAAAALARKYRTVVAVSGAVDAVTDGATLVRIHGGSPLMPRITATGCALTALTGACCALAPDNPLLAAATAMAIFKSAAETAARTARGPGSMSVAFLDALHFLDSAALSAPGRITLEPLP